MKKVLLLVSIVVSQLSLSQSPIIEYRFNQDLFDHSANGINLNPIDFGAITYSYEMGRTNLLGDYCVNLNGQGGFYANNVSNYNWQGTTISFWIKSNFSGGTIMQGAYLGFGVYAMKDIDNNTNRVTTFFDGSSGNGQLFCTPFSIINDQWNHIAIKNTGSKTYYYFNGEIKDSVSETMYTCPSNTNGTLYIGELNNGTGRLNGSLDDIKIYNVALTDQQILDLFQENLFSNSISEINQNDNFNVYPNPMKDEFTIQTQYPNNYILMDSKGNVLMEKYIENKEFISMSNFESGLYFIKSTEGKIIKLIKE